MILQKVTIRNYRSIEYAEIDFIEKAQILVGINESGKSNVLKALALLKKEILPIKEDVRLPRTDKENVDIAEVVFEFKLTDEQIETICARAILKLNIDENIFCIRDKEGKAISIKEFCKLSKPLYVSNLKNQKKYMSHYEDEWQGFKFNLKMYKFTKSIPGNFAVLLPKPDIKYSSVVPENLGGFFEAAEIGDFLEFLSVEINKEAEKYIPNVIYWEYTDKNLLPGSIPLDAFIQSPDSCLPLKFMFELAGFPKIKEAVDEARGKADRSLKLIMNKVSKVTSQHLHDVWKEYKDVKIKLEMNGPNLEISIMDDGKDDDSVPFTMAQRSDGFRRFATFLIMISSRVKSKNLKDNLILMDEPDGSLHPSGARYLLEELINISKENNVVLSTHSIFMIDKKNIERHLIVEKVKESSEIKRANSSNYFEEEVLFQALNCSVFEMLKEKNIIFEGWHDYELFQKCILNNPKQEQLKSNFSSLGLCFGRGAEGLNNIAVIFQAGRRDCVIISDNDEPATRGQREHREKKVLGKWVTYFDLNKDKRILTAEDFIKNTFFEQFLKELNAKIIKLVPGLEELKSTDFQQDKPKIVVLYEWIAKANLKKEELKQVKAEIKNMVFENVTPDDIIDEYFETIKELVRSIS